MSTTTPRPGPWPREVPPSTPGPARNQDASDFLSEESPEFQAARRAAAEARQHRTADDPFVSESALPAAPPASGSGPGPGLADGGGVGPDRAPTLTAAARRLLGPVLATVVVVGAVAWWWTEQPRPTETAVSAAPPPAAADAPPGSPAAESPAAVPAAAGTRGTVIIESRPAGADVFVGGAPRGTTPLELTLPVGPHAVELRNGGATRQLTVTADAGTTVREVVDLVPAVRTGRLEVSSSVTGAPVAVDGVQRGATPLSLSGIAPGTHRVVIGTGASAISRTVTIEAGGTASVVAAAAPTAAAEGGWVTFRSPIELEVFENGRRLGTTRTNRLLLAPGPHDLELVSEEWEVRTTITGVVTEGRGITLPVTLPTGQLFINAVPWANVWVDDRPLGSTPLANVAVTVGPHEIIWRHPELGERRQTVRVGAETPARVGIDLTTE